MAIKDHFKFVDSDEPELEDDQWEYLPDPNWHIQDASFYGGQYPVGYIDKEQGELIHLGDHETLMGAMQAVPLLAATRCIEQSASIPELERGINAFCKVMDLPAQSWDEILVSDTSLSGPVRHLLTCAIDRHEQLAMQQPAPQSPVPPGP